MIFAILDVSPLHVAINMCINCNTVLYINIWQPSIYRLGRSLSLLKNRFFGPRTAKSQPIWIKFWTPIVVQDTLVGRLYRDQRMGSSRPNQNDYVCL